MVCLISYIFGIVDSGIIMTISFIVIRYLHIV